VSGSGNASAGGGPRRHPRVAVSRLARFVRADDWWDHKILPLVGVYAATALVLRAPVRAIWPAGLALAAALALLAAFAALINDLCDVEDDRRGGKPNLLALHPRSWVLAGLAASLAGGAVFAWQWRHAALLDGAYVSAWLAFAAYSLPPLRLKARGGWGIVAIGLGEAALPSLVALALCGRAAGTAPGSGWAAAVGLWSFCHGVRAILWHQLRDRVADARAALGTFVRRRGAGLAARIARQGVFPVELAALAAMLAMIPSVLPWIALGAYLGVTWLRVRRLSLVPVIVRPVPRHLLLLQDYYVYYLPLAVVAASAAAAAATHDIAGALMPFVWLAPFPRPMVRLAGGLARLARRTERAPRRRTSAS
jgi:hypothetical protein